jgi:hypothetical protein
LAKKETPVFDDYEYGCGYDYLLDDQQKNCPPTPQTMPMGRMRTKAPGGMTSRRQLFLPGL